MLKTKNKYYYLLDEKFLKENIHMSRIFTLLTIVYLIPAFSDAQFADGQKLIGGNLLFSTNSGTSTPGAFDNRNVYHNSGTFAGINPSIAKFRTSKVLYGIGIIYNYSTYFIEEELPDNGNNYKNRSHLVGLNIFSQRFVSLRNNFFFTIHTGGSGLYSFSKQADFISKATSTVKGYSINAALAPGISYKISNRFLFDAFLSIFLYAGFQHSVTTSNYPLPREAKTHNNSFNISTSFSNTALGNIGLGFRWLLKRK